MSQDKCSLHNRCFGMDYFWNSWVEHKISSNSRMKMTENTHFHLLGMRSLNGLMETVNYMVLIMLRRQHFSPKHWTDVLVPILSVIKITTHKICYELLCFPCFVFCSFVSFLFFSVCLFVSWHKKFKTGWAGANSLRWPGKLICRVPEHYCLCKERATSASVME